MAEIVAPTRVLMLDMVANFGTKEFIEHTAARYPNCVFYFSRPPAAGESWFGTYLECLASVRELDIQVVVALCDRGAVIQATLAVEFPHIKAPSFESFHVTFDKTLTRKYIIPEKYSLPYYSLPVDEMRGEIPAYDIIDQVGLPCIAKPANGTGSALIKALRKREDFTVLGSDYFIESTEGMLAPIQELIETFLDCSKYTCATTPKLIIEEYVDRTQGGITISTVDGLVQNGRLIRWTMSDNRYWEHMPDAFLGITMPSTLPDIVQEKAWECLEVLVEQLKPYGFDDQFIDAEIFAYADGTIKVMEINGRMFNMMNYLYDAMMENGNQYRACIELGKGNEVPEPRLKPNLFGVYTYLNVMKTGRVGDFINFDAIEEINGPKFVMRSSPDDLITEPGSTGHFAGAVCLLGASFEDCCQQMHQYKHKVFKREDASPWFSTSA